MRIIVHSPQVAVAISRASFPFLLKLGYLISNETASIGDAEIFIELISNLDKGSKRFKLEIMLSDLDKDEFAEEIDEIKTFFKTTKAYNKLKHKTTFQVKWYLGIEHDIMNFYYDWLEKKKAQLKSEGYLSIKPLMDGKILGQYFLEESQSKYYDDSAGFLMNIITIMKLELPDTSCKKSLLAFHDIFLNTKIIKDVPFVSPLSDTANDLNNSYFYYVASISNLNSLSEAELRVIRLSFFDKLVPFRNLVDQWTECCNTSTDKTASLQFFKEQIIPILPTVNKCFEEDKMLSYRIKDSTRKQFYLYMGEITKTALLNYYEKLEAISDEESIYFESCFNREDEFDRRIPMMILSSNANLVLPKPGDEVNDNEEGEIILTKRKYIKIDDDNMN